MKGSALSPRRAWKEFRRALVIAVKDIRIYCLKPPVLLMGIIFPFFLFLAFYVGKKGPITEGIPGLVAIATFFAASNIAPVGMPFERLARTFERYLTAPITISWVVFGKTVAGFLFGTVISVIPLLVGIIWYGSAVSSLLVLIVATLLGALCFSCMGTLFATIPTDAPGNVMTVLNFIRLPVLFMSGVFVPLATMPGWARGLASVSPLTYMNDLLRSSLGLSRHYAVWLSLLILCLFTIAFYGVALWLFMISRKRM